MAEREPRPNNPERGGSHESRAFKFATPSEAVAAAAHVQAKLGMLGNYVNVVSHDIKVVPSSTDATADVVVSHPTAEVAGGRSVSDMLQSGDVSKNEAAQIANTSENLAHYVNDTVSHGGLVDALRTGMESYKYVPGTRRVVMTNLTPYKAGYVIPVPTERHTGYQVPIVEAVSKIGQDLMALGRAVPGMERDAVNALNTVFANLASGEHGPPSPAMSELHRQARLAIDRGDTRFFREIRSAVVPQNVHELAYLHRDGKGDPGRDPLGYWKAVVAGGYNTGAYVAARDIGGAHAETYYTVTGQTAPGTIFTPDQAMLLDHNAEVIRLNRELDQRERLLGREIDEATGGRESDGRDDPEDPSGGTPVSPKDPTDPLPPAPNTSSHQEQVRDERHRELTEGNTSEGKGTPEREPGSGGPSPSEGDETNNSKSNEITNDSTERHQREVDAARDKALSLADAAERGVVPSAPEDTSKSRAVEQSQAAPGVEKDAPGENTANTQGTNAGGQGSARDAKVAELTIEARGLAEGANPSVSGRSTPEKESQTLERDGLETSTSGDIQASEADPTAAESNEAGTDAEKAAREAELAEQRRREELARTLDAPVRTHEPGESDKKPPVREHDGVEIFIGDNSRSGRSDDSQTPDSKLKEARGVEAGVSQTPSSPAPERDPFDSQAMMANLLAQGQRDREAAEQREARLRPPAPVLDQEARERQDAHDRAIHEAVAEVIRPQIAGAEAGQARVQDRANELMRKEGLGRAEALKRVRQEDLARTPQVVRNRGLEQDGRGVERTRN